MTFDVYCAGNDKVLRFLENVLDEVCELFPDPVVHIGGDEVQKANWKACPKCQARMAAVAEMFWTAPKVRDLKEFLPRLRVHVGRLRKEGVNCSDVSEEPPSEK